ncbi:MAG: diguanylate cyclase [Gammaproteobacteria bacterium]|nr:diguanylate cyclase [Gammaproteobacteria bacterium]
MILFQNSRFLDVFCLRILLAALPILCCVPALAADAELEARFKHFEDDTLSRTQEDLLAELKAIEQQIPKGDQASWRRWRRLWCWNGQDDGSESAVLYANEQLAEARRAGDKAAEVDFLLCRGYYHEAAGDKKQGEDDYSTALKLAEQYQQTRLLADAYSLRGMSESQTGRLAEGLRDLQTAQRIYEMLQLHYWSRDNLANIANTYRRLGDVEKALEYYNQLRQIHETEKDYLAVGSILSLSADALEDLGRYEEALATYRLAAEYRRKGGLSETEAPSHLGLGSALLHLGRHAEALKSLAAARADAEKLKNPGGIGLVDLFEGQALAGLGRHEEALARFAAAEPHFRKSELTRYLAWLQQARRDVLAAQGRWQAAYEEGLAFQQTHEALDRLLREHESSRLRIEFDTERKETENKQLQMEKALKEREVVALDEARRWQWGVIALASILLVILLGLAGRQIRRARRLHVLAMTDELTQIANRRHIEMDGAEAIRKSREDKRPMSILVFDVDYFKRTNDSYGHGVGDQVLVRVAKASQAVLRQFDRLGRTGGEEFLVVLPNTNLMQAVQVAERLRAGVASVVMRDLAEDLRTTISIGVAELKPDDADLRAITGRADNALYRAKGNGRNRVEFES